MGAKVVIFCLKEVLSEVEMWFLGRLFSFLAIFCYLCHEFALPRNLQFAGAVAWEAARRPFQGRCVPHDCYPRVDSLTAFARMTRGYLATSWQVTLSGWWVTAGGVAWQFAINN